MLWVRKRDQRPLLATFGTILLVAAAIGTWTGGQHGALTAVGGVAIGALTIVLLCTVIGPQFDPDPVDWYVVLAGAVLTVGGLAVAQFYLYPTLGNTAMLVTVAGTVIAVGASVGFIGANEFVRGAGYGLLAGALGGLLFVPIATYQSFTMRPSLDVIVLLSGAVGPVVFGFLGGIGGSVGGSIQSFDPVKSA